MVQRTGERLRLRHPSPRSQFSDTDFDIVTRVAIVSCESRSSNEEVFSSLNIPQMFHLDLLIFSRGIESSLG